MIIDTAGFVNWQPDNDPGMPFEYKCGYLCQKNYDEKWPTKYGPWTKTIWDCEIRFPSLMYVCENGNYIKPSFNFYKTDFGSIPPPIRGLPGLSETRFLLGYLFHDNIYIVNGHWVWISYDQGNNWTSISFTREQTDNLLREMIIHDPQPGNIFIRNIIWSQVRMWGSFSWNHNRERFNKLNRTNQK